MPVETAGDRLIMLQDFGETVAFQPELGTPANIVAIFDNAYEALDAGGTIDVMSVSPRLTVRSEDILNIQEGDIFVVRNTTYYVRIIMEDGTGLAELVLEKDE